MKYFLIAFCAISGFCLRVSAMTEITDADQITEEWLISAGNESGYTEHVRHFKVLFNKMKVRTFLEFGVGFSTKYFIDNSEDVISVEIVTPGTGPDWLKYCIKLYHNYENWMPIAYFTGKDLDTNWALHKYMGAESVYKAAAYQPSHLKSYALIDPSFLDDLDTFIRRQTAKNNVDVAFVDAGVCLRGDLVQTLFHKVPIIVAHDICAKEHRLDNDVYGYGRIVVPEDYLEMHIPFGMGTAFWIKKEDQYFGLIWALQKYSDTGGASF